MTMTASSTPEEGNVSVVVRARPPNRRELEGNHHSVLQVVDHSMLVFDPEGHDTSGVFSSLRGHDGPKRKGKDLKFIFDHVFGESSKQQDVFEHTTKQILDGVLNGYNCSVFAYGATGSGKTHTMLGSETEPGVMYLTMIELYRRIDAIKEEKLCEVLISYLEVYNEQIEDLLEPRGPLAIREDPQKGVVVQGLSFHQPKSAEQLLQMLASGNLNRTQHPTDANATSSRSHAVFQIYVKQQDRVASISQDVRVAKMSLIDLAGSERASSTNAKGERLREGANINRSLLALINVINALADAKSRKAHIPYRDSKLTRLLKDSIGGNCRTVMIAAVSPSSLSYDDTYNTLKYANRAKEIKLSLKSNVINLDCHISKYAAVCEELKAEVDDLKAKLRSYERKEIGLQQPNDVPACHSPEHQTSPRLEEPPDTGSSEQGYKTRLRVLGSRSSCQCRDQKRLGQRFKKNREKPDPVSQNSSLGGAEQEKGLSFLEGPSGKRTDRLVGALLQVVRKQWEILKCANLQTPEMDTELQELELLALGSPSINHVKKIEKEQKTEVCEAEASKTLGEENLQLPAMEGVVSVDKQESNIAPVTPIRKRQPVKRCWQELLPDVGPTLGSPVVPAKRRRQTEASTSSKANGSALSSTPDVQIKRPRKTSIPSRSQPALRPSAGLLSRKTSQPPPSQPKLKQSSHCTTKYTMQKTPNLLLNPTKSRVPLGTSAMQNHTSVPVTAQAANDLNTTFDMSEECCLAPELNKTVIFGTSGFPGWENVGVQHMDSTFGKSSDVTVFTMKGLSVKRPNATQMAPATKSYSLRRRRSISTSTSRAVNGTLSNSHIVRLYGTTVKKIQQPKTIAENISCSPRGQSGKRTGRGAVAFGRSLPAAPMTRFMQSLSQKCIV